MDKREEMMQIVRDNSSEFIGKAYYYPYISNKINAKIAKNFDANVNINNVVAVHDTTLFGNCKNGMVYMLTGAYYLELFEKPLYFNYEDIVDIEIIPDTKSSVEGMNDQLTISMKNESVISIGVGSFYKVNLKALLLRLKDQFLKYDDGVCIKPSGAVGKVQLTDDQKVKCNTIIHTAAVAAGGVGTGLAQIPLSDNAVITPIQITMIASLGAVFGIHVTDGIAKGILGSLMASTIGRGAVQVLVGWIPGIGNAINTATAAAITETIGWTAVAHFFNLQQQEKAKYKIDGMKDGYNAASKEYEAKLRKQGDEFIKQKKVYKEETEQYEQLLSEYEEYICKLENEQKALGNESSNLSVLKNQYNSLRLLKNY